jgi:hypothetical protein
MTLLMKSRAITVVSTSLSTNFQWATNNIVLVCSNLITPRPIVEVGTRSHVVKSAIPENCTTKSKPNGIEEEQRAEHSCENLIYLAPGLLIVFERTEKRACAVGYNRKSKATT